MSTFLQTAAGVLVVVIFGIALSKQSKDWALVLSVLACCSVLAIMAAYLEPIIAFVNQLRSLGNLDGEAFGIVLKVVGLGVISEIASLICQDSGNAALGKGLQMLSAVVILWLSLPLMQGLLEMVQKIMGDV